MGGMLIGLEFNIISIKKSSALKFKRGIFRRIKVEGRAKCCASNLTRASSVGSGQLRRKQGNRTIANKGASSTLYVGVMDVESMFEQSF